MFVCVRIGVCMFVCVRDRGLWKKATDVSFIPVAVCQNTYIQAVTWICPGNHRQMHVCDLNTSLLDEKGDMYLQSLETYRW